MSSYCTVRQHSASVLEILLKGHWTVTLLREIGDELSRLPVGAARQVMIEGAGLEDFDTSAAWYLNEWVRSLQGRGMTVKLNDFQDNHRRIFERVSKLPHEKEEMMRAAPPAQAVVMALGQKMVEVWQDISRGIGFFGAFLAGSAGRIIHPKRLRLRSVVFHINEVGIKAIPIIALMAFSIAFVMGYQGAFQLQKFDATVYTVDLVVLSILREMGVLITAIMVAGRSGSAFAAQLGTMNLNEEVDALKTMGVAPFEVLVLPRLLAIVIALPLLTIVADMTGLLGGYVFSSSFLGYSSVQFMSRMQEAADMRQFYVGVSKAPVFAVLIGIVGCMQGLQAKGSAEEVGRRTITAVVQSIFLVIVADALFSVIFTRLGI